MANSYFQFKQFRIEQSGCAMKVGTDGVLLGAWADVEEDDTILDVGTGSGLIALMVAQRNSIANITAIDIDEGAYIQAKENVEASKWKERIEVLHSSLQNLGKSNYKHIIANPPFFNNSLKAPDTSRNTARHTDALSYSDLILHSVQRLNGTGKLSLILPYDEKENIIFIAKNNGLILSRQISVFPKPNSNPKRVLLEFSKKEVAECLYSEITLETEIRNVLTAEFKALTKEFYLDR